jgi:hypothetical protein
MANAPIVYRTVTLLPGESYVLPSGASIIGVSDAGLLASDNNCANLDSLEEFACYALVLTADERGGLSGDGPWMEGQGYINSYTIGGVNYLTDNPNTAVIGAAGEYFFGGLRTSILNNTQVSGLFLDITLNEIDDNAAEGGLGSICFKTLPSVGDNMTVTVKSVLKTIKDPFIELKVQPIDYYGGSGSFAGMCSCTVEPPVN